MKSSRKDLIIKALRTAKEKIIELHYSEFTQAMFRKIVVNFEVSLHNVKLVPQLDDRISSINISSLKCLLSQSEDKRRRHFYEDYSMNLILKDRVWAFEVIGEHPLCWFMGPKFDYPNLAAKNAYIRGSALFMQNFSFKLHADNEDMLNFYLYVNTLRTEYSQALKSFFVKSIESFKEYDDLFNQLNNKAEEIKSNGRVAIIGGISIESILRAITIDARINNVSCFFINRHDVCVYGNVAEVTSLDSFNYILDTFQVSTVDFGKSDALCDLSEASTVYISTKKLQVNLLVSNNHPQIGVDFSEKLECSWNAHFLRHLLSLARDFRNFKASLVTASGVAQQTSPSYLPQSLPVGLDIKKLRNISIKHADVNVDKLFLLINELSGENLFFYHYF